MRHGILHHIDILLFSVEDHELLLQHVKALLEVVILLQAVNIQHHHHTHRQHRLHCQLQPHYIHHPQWEKL